MSNKIEVKDSTGAVYQFDIAGIGMYQKEGTLRIYTGKTSSTSWYDTETVAIFTNPIYARFLHE